MKFRQTISFLLAVSVFAWTTEVYARGGGGGGRGGGGGGGASRGGGGGGSRSASRPSGGGGKSVSRPSGGSKPSVSRPSGGGSRPSTSKPATRPSTSKPATRPSGGGGSGASRPTTKPAQRPSGGGGSSVSRPSTKPAKPPSVNKPSTRPANPPNVANRPSTRPGTVDRPGGGERPSTLPGTAGNRPGNGNIKLPGQGGERPSTLPGTTKPGDRPGIANRPGEGNRPSTLPGTVRPGERPGQGKPGQGLNRPTTLPAERPGIANRPGERPGAGNRPTTLPGTVRPGDRPGIANRPGGDRPGDRPWNRPENRPDWGDKWNNSNNNFGNQFNNWHNENNVNINNFENNRSDRWNNINNNWNDRDWHNRFDSDEYWEWRQDVVGFRGDRCHEIWNGCYGFGYHDHFFNHGYWGSGACWWGAAAVAGTAAAVTSAIISPWWWWRPATYTSVATFYGPTYPAQPVVYDPGTTVIYEGDTIYINGKEAGNATEYREKTIELASPPVETYPVPEPPAEEGQAEAWLPMGVWALTQQEQGDAVMFFQLSVDKNGIVAGAYKNVMTNEDQPIVGQVDKDGQRLAWHVGENTNTVYETGISSLTYDVASVFVHFGPDQTQTWLLVRLPSPEMPPGTVKLPEIKKPEPAPAPK